MKNRVKILFSLVTVIVLSGCVTQPNGLSAKPVIEKGTATNLKPMQYVTLIPSGSKVPFHISIKGDTFKKDVKKSIALVLKNDLYIYGNTRKKNEMIWVSYDRKHWYRMDRAFKGEMSFRVEHTVKGSSLNLSLKADRRKEDSK